MQGAFRRKIYFDRMSLNRCKTGLFDIAWMDWKTAAWTVSKINFDTTKQSILTLLSRRAAITIDETGSIAEMSLFLRDTGWNVFWLLRREIVRFKIGIGKSLLASRGILSTARPFSLVDFVFPNRYLPSQNFRGKKRETFFTFRQLKVATVTGNKF